MNYLWEGIIEAIHLIISFDPEFISICFVSIRISLISITLATIVGLPTGFFIGYRKFFGKRIVETVLNTLLALPTVVVGLFVYSLLSRIAPFGSLNLLFTPTAMVVGQFILATPIIAALTMSYIRGVDPRVELTAKTLGASRAQVGFAILFESRFAIAAAIIAGFGRVFAEVGVSMMLGGNIKGYTRNITTAIAFETGKGEFALGLALGFVLLSVAFLLNLVYQFLQRRKG